MRLPNDQVFVDSVPGLDLCLGGHDHMYVAEMRESTGAALVKSGTDFEEFSDIQINFGVSQDEADKVIRDKKKDPNLVVLYSKQKQMLV